jgi:hypothetical protein
MTKKPKMEHVAIPNTVFHHMRGSFVIRPKCLSWLKGQKKVSDAAHLELGKSYQRNRRQTHADDRTQQTKVSDGSVNSSGKE